MPDLAIVKAFKDLPDSRRTAGQRHHQSLCLALFTLAVTAGNRGFLAIGDWLKAHRQELVELFQPTKGRIPSYSTLRRVLLQIDAQSYSDCLAKFVITQPTENNDLSGSNAIKIESSIDNP